MTGGFTWRRGGLFETNGGYIVLQYCPLYMRWRGTEGLAKEQHFVNS